MTAPQQPPTDGARYMATFGPEDDDCEICQLMRGAPATVYESHGQRSQAVNAGDLDVATIRRLEVLMLGGRRLPRESPPSFRGRRKFRR